ncbi:hypothetical protein JAB6_49690 [Janthinobacterium sp. HH104]|nr:hypothetical protein JAB6_49690 [Janthinobacterium sp. HH104]
MPPVAVTPWLKATPAVMAGKAAGATLIAGTATVSEYARVPAYGPLPVELSVARTVKLKVPPAVGVPASRPALDKVTPAGKAPALTA